MKEPKKLLIGLGIVLVLCCFAAGVFALAFRELGKRMVNAISTEPAVVDKAKKNIADFDVPKGYRGMVMSLPGYEMINFAPEKPGNRMTIMLMQYSGIISGNAEQMKEQLRQSAQQQSNQPGATTKLVETREVVIRGETVTATINESTYQDFVIRQWMTIFTGNKGPTILLIQGPPDQWDEQFIEDFIKSFR